MKKPSRLSDREVLLQTTLGHSFQAPDLLRRALTHKSHPDKENNQILEFLGDSVLNLVVSARLVSRFPKASEGTLSRMRALLVRGTTLAEIAAQLSLSPLLRQGLAQSKLKCPSSALEDALEALIGALYLDGGLDAASRVVEKFWKNYFELLTLDDLKLDAKSELQIYCQQKNFSLPSYTTQQIKGQPPEELFCVKVSVHTPGSEEEAAEGKSKKEAQQRAASKLLQRLTENERDE